MTILLAVETGDPTIPDGDIGSVSNPHVWGRVNAVAGTSAKAYRTSIEHVLDTYDAINNPAQWRTLIHDNLLLHKALEVYEAVRDRGYCIVCRPPYRPQDGPVEFAINQVCCGIERRWSEVSDLPTMQTLVKDLKLMSAFWEWMLCLSNADIYGTRINKLFVIMILSCALVNYDYKIDTISNESDYHYYALFFDDSFLP